MTLRRAISGRRGERRGRATLATALVAGAAGGEQLVACAVPGPEERDHPDGHPLEQEPL